VVPIYRAAISVEHVAAAVQQELEQTIWFEESSEKHYSALRKM
jgi:hypothetical protein